MAQRTVNLENVEALVSELETLPPIASMPALVALAGSLLKAANVAKLQSEFRLFHHQGYGDELEGSVWWSLRGPQGIYDTRKLGLEKAKVSREVSRNVPQFEGDFYALSDENVEKLAQLCRRLLPKAE